MNPEIHAKEALEYYLNHILNAGKNELFKKYNFSTASAVSSLDWELFAAILLNKKKTGTSPDLNGHEVKSAKKGNSFEYQYHKANGLKKLAEDQKVNHVFISYDNQYQDIKVRKISGDTFKAEAINWNKGFRSNYDEGKQRYRKCLSYKYVCGNGKIIMEIKNGRALT